MDKNIIETLSQPFSTYEKVVKMAWFKELFKKKRTDMTRIIMHTKLKYFEPLSIESHEIEFEPLFKSFNKVVASLKDMKIEFSDTYKLINPGIDLDDPTENLELFLRANQTELVISFINACDSSNLKEVAALLLKIDLLFIEPIEITPELSALKERLEMFNNEALPMLTSLRKAIIYAHEKHNISLDEIEGFVSEIKEHITQCHDGDDDQCFPECYLEHTEREKASCLRNSINKLIQRLL